LSGINFDGKTNSGTWFLDFSLFVKFGANLLKNGGVVIV